jgi:hypothetical protein
MAVQRSPFAGATDYRGIDLHDILSHLEVWRSTTQETIELLIGFKAEVEENQERLDDPQDILRFIESFVGLLERYPRDFDRLIKEMPASVEERHVEIVTQLAELSESAQTRCVTFKRNHIERGLRDEDLRGLLDHVYGDTRDQAIDYLDLFNVAGRLKTFVGTSFEHNRISVEDVDVLELKPNVFGFGLNLNHLIKRVGIWWKAKRSK